MMIFGLTACGSGTTGKAPSAETTAPEQEAAKPFTLDQLVATDPATVQLATGKVQLIEFFAYW